MDKAKGDLSCQALLLKVKKAVHFLFSFFPCQIETKNRRLPKGEWKVSLTIFVIGIKIKATESSLGTALLNSSMTDL